MKWGCDHRSCNRNLSNCKFLPEKKFQGFNGIRTRGLCESTAVHLHFIYIPAVQISTSIHVSFLSRVKMNSINCSTANTWVFIAHLVEHCSANAEAMAGQNPVEALKFFFRAKICNCLNCVYNCDDHISISSGRTVPINFNSQNKFIKK